VSNPQADGARWARALSQTEPAFCHSGVIAWPDDQAVPAGVDRERAHPSNRYDGWKLYPCADALHATREIRGRYIYRCEAGAAPEFEISEDRVYRYLAVGGPVYEIRDGRYLHAFGRPRRLFELRPGNARDACGSSPSRPRETATHPHCPT
jgi:hypothetical protein